MRNALEKTRGSAGSSRLNVDDWRRLHLKNFGASIETLRKALADMTKRLCQDKTVEHLDALLACIKYRHFKVSKISSKYVS